MPVRRKHCEERARTLLDGAAITASPVDVEAVASALFLTVVRTEMGEHRGRALLDRGEIRVSASESEAAQRFSIGHEIGHYILHKDEVVFSSHEDPESDLYASDPEKALESEADYFSSVLLVPPRWLRRDVDARRTPQELAKQYAVSPSVIFIALQQHRLLARVAQG